MLKDLKGNTIDFNDEKMFPPEYILAKENPKGGKPAEKVTVDDLSMEEFIKMGTDLINKTLNNNKE